MLLGRGTGLRSKEIEIERGGEAEKGKFFGCAGIESSTLYNWDDVLDTIKRSSRSHEHSLR